MRHVCSLTGVSGHYIWSAPLEALTIIILLITLIGTWGLIALVLMVALIASQVFIGKRVAALRTQNIAATDERVHLMHEILMNIKLVKFYGNVKLHSCGLLFTLLNSPPFFICGYQPGKSHSWRRLPDFG
jgi:hypothetical protein